MSINERECLTNDTTINPSYGSVDRMEGPNGVAGSVPESASASIEARHAEELIHLAQRRYTAHLNWFRTSISYTSAYLRVILSTWTNLANGTVSLLAGKTDLPVIISYLIFTTCVSVVLFFMLIWCIFAHNPVAYSLFTALSRWRANSRGLVNALYDMFRAITKEEAEAGKRALSQAPSSFNAKKREFDLDAAKLLLQFASLMYERGPAAREATHKTNQYLADQSPDDCVDILETPDWLLEEMLGSEHAAEVSKILNGSENDNSITEFTKTFNVQYRPVSELNSLSSAYCALFWDPSSNWIAVSFKGTSPTEFDEWATDLDIIMKAASQWIDGFSKVHGGFLERVFPDRAFVGQAQPFETIVDGVKAVADELLQKLSSSEQVNVWFTGHSLGCATASLTYAKVLGMEKELGDRIVLRDAYLFAAPITCDIASSSSFNIKMCDKSLVQRTMWRITNARDAVATALPDFGDNPKFRTLRGHSTADGDIFMFCHLGTEVKMNSKPKPCQVKGIQFTPDTKITMCSSLDYNLVGTVDPARCLKPSVLLWQKIPLIGRLVQHGTSFYWDQLHRVGVGNCEHTQ